MVGKPSSRCTARASSIECATPERAEPRPILVIASLNLERSSALSIASGAKTLKMKFGHHGANHPVQDLETKQVLITSQNHGFAVDAATLPANCRVTHESLFDGSLQGFARTDKPAFCFQGHPEASPGPTDVAYLFDRFIGLMQAQEKK